MKSMTELSKNTIKNSVPSILRTKNTTRLSKNTAKSLPHNILKTKNSKKDLQICLIYSANLNRIQMNKTGQMKVI